MTTLSLQNIEKQFNDVVAVHEVSLRISAGEFFSLLGPSGCGKTTLLRIVAGFERPTKGSVFLNDQDVTRTPARERGIGMVFQNYALFPHMTVFQNVAFGLEAKKVPKGEVRRRVEAILDAVHLTEKVHTPVPHLSGGEQQRVAVARALVVEPRVLLLDEPLSNLDVALRASTREEIRALQRRTGITTVYVTHDQAEAMSLSDRIAVMERGRIVQAGSPVDIYERPQNAFVAQFLGGANILRGSYDITTRLFTAASFSTRIPEGRWNHPGPLALAIKPEAIMLDAESTADDGTMEGRIVEREYLGFTTTFLLDVAGILLRAASLSSDSLRRIPPGAMVTLHLDWSKITVLSGTG